MKKILIFLFCILPFSVHAKSDCGANEANCWDCGKTENDLCTARKSGNNLTITGSGDMVDYKVAEPSPWGTDITEVKMSGIKSIGTYAFRLSNIQNITIPASVEKLENGALQSMKQLKTVDFEEGSRLQTIECANFMFNSQLESLSLPEGVEYLEYNNFYNSGLTELYLPDSLFHADGTIGLAQNALSSGLTLYCSEENKQRLENYLETAKYLIGMEDGQGVYLPLKGLVSVESFKKIGNQYLYGNKFYNNPNDIVKKQYDKKRIYTVEEATLIASPQGNTFKLKYR